MRMLMVRVRVRMLHTDRHHRLVWHHSLTRHRLLKLPHGCMLVSSALKGVRCGLGRMQGITVETIVTSRAGHGPRREGAWAAVQRPGQTGLGVGIAVMSWDVWELVRAHCCNPGAIAVHKKLMMQMRPRHAAHHGFCVHATVELVSIGREAVAVVRVLWHVLAWQWSLNPKPARHHHLSMWLLAPDRVRNPGCRRRIVATRLRSAVVHECAWLMGSALVLDHGSLAAESLDTTFMSTHVRSLARVNATVSGQTGRLCLFVSLVGSRKETRRMAIY